MNDELQLSSEIGNFETDFSNGYLVGEILHRFNQQKNFHKFVDKHSADAKINNWCLLSPTIIALEPSALSSLRCALQNPD